MLLKRLWSQHHSSFYYFKFSLALPPIAWILRWPSSSFWIKMALKWHQNCFPFFFFFSQNIFVVHDGLEFGLVFLFSRGTNPWSLPPKAAIVKPMLIEVQIKTGPSNIIAFQTGALPPWSSPSAEKTSATTAPIFFFPSKGAATNPQNRFCFQQPAPSSHFYNPCFS